ncbi:hypothetical protein F5883DRAFT_697001 [Diaporthe sp. PMI_573]|nr:hypothetical protein F5883DRAFT_697001 [Diaporthaceae sp. PMI_573]
MDGFHYSRAHLASMPNSVEAIHRRGAAFTFDAAGFYAMIRDLATSPIRTVQAPSFDHEIKDPVSAAITCDAARLMDELWYIDTPSEVTHARLAVRHLASGIVANEKEAWERAVGTDELNAQDIRENRLSSDETINMG